MDQAPTKPDPASRIDEEALARLIDRFTQRYGTFESEQYLRDERAYKIQLAEHTLMLLARENLGSLIEMARSRRQKPRSSAPISVPKIICSISGIAFRLRMRLRKNSCAAWTRCSMETSHLPSDSPLGWSCSAARTLTAGPPRPIF